MMKDENFCPGKVSICVPCYNGARYLERFFQSIQDQTYSALQIIFADDGSVDGTRQIAMEQRDKFVSKGMEFLYLHQTHKGQAAAINLGLPYVTGEYFMWIDSDDFLERNHVEKKVRYLEEHKEADAVMCRGNAFNDDDINHPIGTLGNEEAVGTLFEDILFAYRSCACGLYMVRTKVLFQAIPQKRIYDSRAGQNMQLLLPVTIRNRNGYITDKLYNYVVRENSHSHSVRGGIRWKQHLDQLEDMKRHMLQEIPIDENYRKHLVQILDIQMIDMRVRLIDKQIEEQDEAYIRRICKEYVKCAGIQEKCKEAEIYFWGACHTTEKISRLLGIYAGIKTEKIIDSDNAKAGSICGGKEVIDRDDIRVGNKYIIIPLDYHRELIDLFQSKGLQSMRDYFYPQYEIRRRIIDWNHY